MNLNNVTWKFDYENGVLEILAELKVVALANQNYALKNLVPSKNVLTTKSQDIRVP